MQTLSKYFSLSLVIFVVVMLCGMPAKALPGKGHDPLNTPVHHHFTGNGPTEQSVIERYSRLLRAEETEIKKFLRLYRFIDEWFGTVYSWGGCSKRGIDCSCFVKTLYSDVFNIRINRTSLEQFCKDIVLYPPTRTQFQLGDLVFFKTLYTGETGRNKVTHVGFYLTNGYFVQSSSKGVNIASLNSNYWKGKFVAAGRLKDIYYKKTPGLKPTGEVDNNRTIEVEENSEFDPIFYPEDVDSINDKYSKLLDIDKELIFAPEVFQFIEKNRYAPYDISNRCVKTSATTNNNCFVSAFFKDVFYLSVDNVNNSQFLLKYTGLSARKPRDTIFDIIRLTGISKGRRDTITGIYLYNGYFLHQTGKDIAMSSLEHPDLSGYSRTFFRLNKDRAAEVIRNLRELRKNGGVLPDSLRMDEPAPLKPPVNILKSDTPETEPVERGIIGPPPPADLEDPATAPKTKKPAAVKKKKKRRNG